MCGILGTYRGNTEIIKDAISLLRHRGPDDVFILDSSSFVALGHQRLSIIDTSPFRHQPMISNNGQVVIVFKPQRSIKEINETSF
jgi:asparagine synthase (glutamine-hydrolysing)